MMASLEKADGRDVGRDGDACWDFCEGVCACAGYDMKLSPTWKWQPLLARDAMGWSAWFSKSHAHGGFRLPSMACRARTGPSGAAVDKMSWQQPLARAKLSIRGRGLRGWLGLPPIQADSALSLDSSLAPATTKVMNERQSNAADADNWQRRTILVVDDEAGMRSFLSRALEGKVGSVVTADSAEAGAALLEQRHFDLILLDVALPGISGVEWLKALRAAGNPADVILMTAFADMDTAIAALRSGAADFIVKPFRVDQMLNAIRRCFDRTRLARENYLLRRELDKYTIHKHFIGESEAMKKVMALVARVAPMPSTVLVTGESGTGKEVVARELHHLSGRQGQFVPLNCGAMAPEIIESELFGHAKGAFTGAAGGRHGLFLYADGGTLFLDEISELPLGMQAKLLRVIEDRRIRPLGTEREIAVDVRIVAACNRNLANEVAAGRFRQDLYYRLDVVSIAIPPLRTRPEDIVPLAEHFSEQLSAQLGLPAVPLSPSLIRVLKGYDWPGNARELRNLVERALILGEYPVELLAHQADSPQANLPEAEHEDAAMPADDGTLLESVERRHILQVLAAEGGNRVEAARRLGISRRTLDRKCLQWGLRP
ncbi:major facilitator superfamily MFS OFA family [Cupriavidus necator N-1]|uniref:Major facilitator superfamily MFS OFA family n=2 Tax=Burkholderiaceae TaxID=119060 RepID=F8GNW4_CUPNN|nr:major facilitator superfamily MFS OFA family [Cupriavidus necator N-1]